MNYDMHGGWEPDSTSERQKYLDLSWMVDNAKTTAINTFTWPRRIRKAYKKTGRHWVKPLTPHQRHGKFLLHFAYLVRVLWVFLGGFDAIISGIHWSMYRDPLVFLWTLVGYAAAIGAWAWEEDLRKVGNVLLRPVQKPQQPYVSRHRKPEYDVKVYTKDGYKVFRATARVPVMEP